MHVLVAHSNATECRRLCRLITALGHDVSTPVSLAELSELLVESPPEAALIGVLDKAFSGWMDALAETCKVHPIHIIALIDGWQPREIGLAWEVGADDVMCDHPSTEEVAGRLNSIQRIRKKYAILDEEEVGLKIEKMYAWQYLDQIIGQELRDMLGVEFVTMPLTESPELVMGAEVMVCLADSQREVRLGIGLEAEDVDGLSLHLFESLVSKDALQDAMRELANTAGGAFKREALLQGHTFALGLPRDCDLPSSSTTRYWAVNHAEKIQLVLWAGVKVEKVMSIHARRLREGMVLTRDIRTPGGALLVSAGQVLTHRTCERLIELVGASTILEVNASAAAA